MFDTLYIETLYHVHRSRDAALAYAIQFYVALVKFVQRWGKYKLAEFSQYRKQWREIRLLFVEVR